ncbi:MAG TPA: beta galactosidase jelly roll domain-containing protein, partial [Chitinophagaceae bacterium]
MRIFTGFVLLLIVATGARGQTGGRQRVKINDGWRFMRYDSNPDKLIYDVRPDVNDQNDNVVADTKPTEALAGTATENGLKKWILPTANDFIKDPSRHHQRPEGNPGSDFSFVQNNYDDNGWEQVHLPHDWAITKPFYEGNNVIVGGGMGRLPVHGVAWYRKKINIPAYDKGKTIYLDIDGAMSYAMVWLNGRLVGGWAYGYNSFRLDLTPYINFGGDNQLAIRLDNPTNSSRWYPGGGIYRNVWLTKVNPVHIAQWGTFITTRNVSSSSATIDLKIDIENDLPADQEVVVTTEVFLWDNKLNKIGKKVTAFPKSTQNLQKGKKAKMESSVVLDKPMLWGPLPSQKPNLYVAITKLSINGKLVDAYETRFGVRSIVFDPVKGLIVNGEPIRFKGVNQHHDLGALGAAFNARAAERQLEILA